MRKSANRSQKEMSELKKIQNWFPNARLKEDYNRDILDIGAEIPFDDSFFILLKGDQTGNAYELITPECKCIEGLFDLEEAYDTFQKICRDSSRNDERK